MTPPAARQATEERSYWVQATAAGLLLAIVTSWPLALHLGESMPESGTGDVIGDPYLLAWQIAWEGHALVTDPAQLLHANAFYPEQNSLSFIDVLHGYAPAGMVGFGADAAAIRYNLLYLFAHTLAFVGPFLLARTLGLRLPAAALVGVAFAYAPWRLDHHGQLHVLSSGGIALALSLLVRGYRTSRSRLILAGWVVATWQLTLGFTLGLQFSYALAAIGGIWLIWWWRAGRPSLARPTLIATAAGIALFGAVGGVQALPLFQVAEDHPEAVRPLWEVEFHSPPPHGFAAASESNLLWGRFTTPVRAKLPVPTEQTLFPGLMVLFLALEGVWYRRSLWLRGGLALGTVITAILALGLRGPAGGALYRFLFEYAPGWQSVRTPGRLMTVATLGLALLAGMGFQSWVEALETRWTTGGRRHAARVVAGAVICIVLLEGVRVTNLSPVASVPPSQLAAADPITHLPTHEITDRLYMFWSTEGFPRITNGMGAFVLSEQATARETLADFPDDPSIAYLRGIGVRTVIAHLALMPDGQAWEANAVSRAANVGLSWEKVGTDLVFSL